MPGTYRFNGKIYVTKVVSELPSLHSMFLASAHLHDDFLRFGRFRYHFPSFLRYACISDIVRALHCLYSGVSPLSLYNQEIVLARTSSHTSFPCFDGERGMIPMGSGVAERVFWPPGVLLL
jgi:hypothetical protein